MDDQIEAMRFFGSTPEAVEFAYPHALEHGVKDPAEFVLDVRDEGASWVAERFTTADEVARIIHHRRSREAKHGADRGPRD